MEASKDTKAIKYYVNTNYTRIMADINNIKLFFVRMDNLISRRPLFGPPFICLCNFFQLYSFCGISLRVLEWVLYGGRGGDIGKIINPR